LREIAPVTHQDQAEVVLHSSALAAALPQKHLGTVLRPNDQADLWLLLAQRQTRVARNPGDSFLQTLNNGRRHGVQSGLVAHAPTPTSGSPAVANLT